MRSFVAIALTLVSLAVIGCGPRGPVLPLGVVCSRSVSAGPSLASLRNALSTAAADSCVIAEAGTYDGEVTVPAGVKLVAEVGDVVEIKGSASAPAAVTLSSGSTLANIRVVSLSRIGVLLEGRGTFLVSVVVTGAPGAGIVDWCEEDCRIEELMTTLINVELSGNGVGLIAHATQVSIDGGKIIDSKSMSLASGYGLVASHGAVLKMNGTLVEGNEELGVLIDGAMGTDATLSNVTVRGNKGRGIWAQGLLGTMASPKLKLSTCTIESNRLVGLGARGSRGISVQGGTVSKTVIAKAASSMPGVLVDVGDGIGLFEASGDVKIDAVTFDSNERSQALIDNGSTGLSFTMPTLKQQSGQLGVVVQHTMDTVVAPMIFTPMQGQELSVSSPTLGLPTR